MSAKHKRVQVEIPEWSCCTHCGWKVCSISRHERICTASALVQLEDIAWSDHPGVIYNATFIANARSTDFNQNLVSKSVERKSISEDSVIINPATIRALGGRPIYKQAVVVCNTLIGYICPSDEIPLGDVYLSSQFTSMLEMTDGYRSVITIKLISAEAVEDAAEVLVTLRNGLEGGTDSIDLQRVFIDRLLTIGTLVSLKNSSHDNYVEVNKIVGKSGLTCSLNSMTMQQCKLDSAAKSTLDGDFNLAEKKYKKSRQFYRVTGSTKVSWFNARNENRLNDMINLCAGYEKFRTHLGKIVSSALTGSTDGSSGRGILIHGPTGSGKRYLTEAVCRNITGAQWVELECADVQATYLNGGQAAVVAMFHDAITTSHSLPKRRCIVFLHHIDAICLRRERLNSAHRNLSIAVIVAIDTILAEGDHVLVIATTYERSDIDCELLTGNRLSMDLELTSPTVEDRLHVAYIKAKRSETQPRVNQSDVLAGIPSKLPTKTDTVMKREVNSSDIQPRVNLRRIVLLNGLSQTRKKLATISVAPVKWSDIGGREQLKQSLRQAIEDPIHHSAQYSMFNMDRVKGILLYGPPGCSKTMIAKAIATQCGVNFFAVQGSELLSCYHGESERNIRNVFIKARRAAPSIVFFDEIDAIGGSRGRSGSSNVTGSMMQSLLVEMDGVDTLSNVIIIAATNRPQTMDKALLRPGRLDRKIYVRLPDAETRREIFNIEFRVTPTSTDIHVDELVDKTDGFSCAEVVHLCNEARMAAFREYKESVTAVYARHFNAALTKVTPRTDRSALEVYEQFERGSKH